MGDKQYFHRINRTSTVTFNNERFRVDIGENVQFGDHLPIGHETASLTCLLVVTALLEGDSAAHELWDANLG